MDKEIDSDIKMFTLRLGLELGLVLWLGLMLWLGLGLHVRIKFPEDSV